MRYTGDPQNRPHDGPYSRIAVYRCGARGRMSLEAPSQLQAGLGGQPEELLAHVVGRPAAGVPLLGGHVVATIEHLPEWHIAVARDGEEGGGLHLDGEAALGAAAANLGRRLAVDGVGGP